MEPGGIEPDPIPGPLTPNADSAPLRATGRATHPSRQLARLVELWSSLAPPVRAGLVAAAEAAANSQSPPPDTQTDPCLLDGRSHARQGVPCEHGGKAGVRQPNAPDRAADAADAGAAGDAAVGSARGSES